ncbi:tyrosine-type recombinase/integrase [Bradyrhizobium japonicum]|uniref:tyrosine-type recombinase/integrase n=1 Tax=Bradyrhizobium japonicum TaxID=375 RepID=UPI002714B16C|nr:integrase arm-type DNA-binding domain-containing protein [Bradyrhizobium japonicum]WLB18911.1 integrase arm-type DNA-binding domain-containing protein [Bradyrhizobium japonicum]
MLTQVGVRAAKPREKPYKLPDGNGLHLLIETNGSKLWRFRYQFDRKEKMLSLGAFPDVTIAQARQKRDDARSVLAGGVDPARKREQDKIAASIAAANTFGVVAAEYLERMRTENAAESTITKNKWLLEDLAASLANRPIAEITPAELLQLLQRIEKTGRRETAHRLRGTLGSVFRYAVRTLRAPLDITSALKGALLKVEVTHRPAITEELQLGGLMLAIDEYDGWPTLRAALLLLALTMVRPGEVRHMRKSELIVPKALWRIPEERTKTRRPFDVPLSKQALAVISEIWDLTPGNGLLLPSIRSSIKPLSENALNSALRRMGYRKDEMTAHGFRSSASTILNEYRVADADVIEAALAHQEEDDVRRAYNRALYLKERTVLMQRWADLLDEFRQMPNSSTWKRNIL